MSLSAIQRVMDSIGCTLPVFESEDGDVIIEDYFTGDSDALSALALALTAAGWDTELGEHTLTVTRGV